MARKREATGRRIRRDLARMGVGVLDITSPATVRRAIERHHAIVDKLAEDSQVEVLRALRDRRISLDELVDLDRQGRLSGAGVLAAVQLQRPLFEAWAAAAERMGKSRPGSRRYAGTFSALQRRGAPIITAETLIADLAVPERVNWQALREQWGGSPADWMHVRRAISRLLTILLGDKYHPFRRQVVQLIPTAPEPPRTPDLSPDRFWKIVEAAREDLRPALVCLVATGMRVQSEYLKCTADHLLPETKAVRVPGTKTEGSNAVIHVDERLWPWVVAAIPAPLAYKALRNQWQAACAKAGVQDVVLHDLRHCHAQWATDGGMALRKVADSLRHATTTTTERYARGKDTRDVSSAVADSLMEARPDA
jgi:integrase